MLCVLGVVTLYSEGLLGSLLGSSHNESFYCKLCSTWLVSLGFMLSLNLLLNLGCFAAFLANFLHSLILLLFSVSILSVLRADLTGFVPDGLGGCVAVCTVSSVIPCLSDFIGLTRFTFLQLGRKLQIKKITRINSTPICYK